ADAMVLEARSRFGGRILTAGGSADTGDDQDDYDAECDLGPSWFWPGQPLVESLLSQFEIPYFEQFSDGAVVYQQPDGSCVRTPGPSPMAGSFRIRGGVGRLIDRIVDEIGAPARLLEHVVTGLSAEHDRILVEASGPSGMVRVQAKRVALAIPPRLAAELRFVPELPPHAVQLMNATPTWMAGHAKFFAVYDEPFWRRQGLCGSAISRRGPLAEIHDASAESAATFSLFGFAGLDAQRRAEMGRGAFLDQATAQLARLFGDEAKRPKAVFLQDWSTERFTASSADRKSQIRHPEYGLSPDFGPVWGSRLALVSSETSFGNGGLIEGALEAGLRFCARTADLDLPLLGRSGRVHEASMGWDWL
ncbi:MAG: FAD-dependent oxidoreductase, partial [Acidobacteriota bacterium]